MTRISRGMGLLLAGLCLAAPSAAVASDKACTVGAAGARAEAARLAELIPPQNEAEIAWCPDAIPVLVAMLDDKAWKARNEAAGALRNATADDGSRTTDDEMRKAVLPHLAALGAATKRLGGSTGPTGMSDWGAAVMLQDVLRGLGKEAVPHLAEGLRSPKTRYSAASNLGSMGAQAAAALPALRAALAGQNEETDARAIQAAIKAIAGK